MNAAHNLGLDVLEAPPPTPRAESEKALADLGLAVEHGDDVGAIMRVLDGLVTSGGHARQTRLEFCGVAYPALDENGEIVWCRRGCRDRFCPSCGDRLGRRLARAVAQRAAQCLQVLSIALTRPKVASETPGQALDAMSKACTKLMASPLCRTRSKANPPPLPGGVRFLEVTARAAGQRIGDYVVPAGGGGIHAHAHIIAQLRPDWTLERATTAIVETWQAIVGGAAAGAQHITRIAAGDIGRAAAYAASFGGLARLVDVAPQYARAVAAAMAKRVLVRTWGKGWLGILKPAKSGARMGSRSIANLLQTPSGLVRFGEQVWTASDVVRRLQNKPRKLGEEAET